MSTRKTILLTVVLLVAALLAAAPVSADSAAIWTEIYPTGTIPDGSLGEADAYDPYSDRVILFNSWTVSTPYNDNDVWVLKNATGRTGQPEWLNLIPSYQSGSPSPRHGHGSIYDPISNRLMLFGGCGGGCYPTLGDMWVLTNANGTEATPSQWIQLSPSGVPPYSRNAPRLSYDPGTNRMILFSGQTGSGWGGSVFNDVWVLTNANGLGGTPEWIKLVSSMPIMGQYYAGTGYDQANNRLIIYGGWNQNGQPTNGVWILTNANGLGGPSELVNLIPDGSETAPPKTYGSTIYVPARNQLMFFIADESPWILDNANGLGGSPVWTQLDSSGNTPSSPRGPACCYDPLQERVLLLEGTSMTNAWWMTFNQPPIANAGGPYSLDEGNTIQLDASASTDPDNTIATYEWDLDNDGEYDDATGAEVPHTYGDNGLYAVGLRATDTFGETDTDETTVTVSNVAPTVNTPTVVPGSSDEGEPVTASATFSDPGFDDSPFTCSVDYGDGGALQPATVSGNTCTGSPHVYGDDETYTVLVTVTDKDGDSGSNTVAHQVDNVPPVATVDIASQTVQYSDGIAAVTITGTDVAADNPLTATATGLPNGTSLTPGGCVTNGQVVCTWTVSGIADAPAGTYDVTVTVTDSDGGSTVVVTTVVVEHEDAWVSFADTNEVAVAVASDGGNSGAFSLTVAVQELFPDLAVNTAYPGDIGLADVSIALVPVGPGSSASPTGACTETVTGTGYNGVLTVTCPFDGVDVNAYTVDVTVNGGFYTGGNEDVLVVYDPTLGFTTGGGWFYWPGTEDPEAGYLGDKTNFGYTMKYNKKGNKVKGSYLLIRHLDDGTKYRVKSNALYGLALGGDSDMGWASFSGKATYLQPGWEDPKGNHEFVVYVEDYGEPGTGVDRMWLETHNGDGDMIPALSMDRDPADNAETINGGNIVAPH